jgi:hypothetical protein
LYQDSEYVSESVSDSQYTDEDFQEYDETLETYSTYIKRNFETDSQYYDDEESENSYE